MKGQIRFANGKKILDLRGLKPFWWSTKTAYWYYLDINVNCKTGIFEYPPNKDWQWTDDVFQYLSTGYQIDEVWTHNYRYEI